jgi:hypothetical protein
MSTHVDRWFSSLSAEERKEALYALHCYRSLGDNMAPSVALAHARDIWRFLEGLLPALEDDHEALKREESRPTIPSPRISGEYSVVPGPPDAKLKK